MLILVKIFFLLKCVHFLHIKKSKWHLFKFSNVNSREKYVKNKWKHFSLLFNNKKALSAVLEETSTMSPTVLISSKISKFPKYIYFYTNTIHNEISLTSPLFLLDSNEIKWRKNSFSCFSFSKYLSSNTLNSQFNLFHVSQVFLLWKTSHILHTNIWSDTPPFRKDLNNIKLCSDMSSVEWNTEERLICVSLYVS